MSGGAIFRKMNLRAATPQKPVVNGWSSSTRLRRERHISTASTWTDRPMLVRYHGALG
jgi:hypothetical protein